MPLGNFGKQLLRFAPVTFEGYQDRDFVPDVLKPLAVVGQDLIEYLAVRDMDHTPRALVGVNPVADFHQAEHEDPLVDDVAPNRRPAGCGRRP